MAEVAPGAGGNLKRPGGRDLVAGLSVAGLLLPEAVAYATIAGLPPGRSIYAAVAGCFVYAIIGRSRFAVVSATSSSAAILSAMLATFPGDAATKSALATLAIAIAGLVFLAAWALRLGILTGFIARPVLRGFAFGLAVSIILHQLPSITGVPVKADDIFEFIAGLVKSIPHWNPAGLIAAALSLAVLFGTRRWPLFPAAFAVVIAGASLSLALDLPQYGLKETGALSLTLEWPHWPILGWPDLSRLVQLTLPLVLILFAESWGTMRALALRHGDPIVPDRELAALGFSNIAAAIVQGMPVGAGFSAGNANESAGAESRWSSLIAACALAVLVVVAAGLIAHLPEAVLAAIVISALAHALDPSPLIRLWKIDRDQWIALAAASGVLVFGVVNGMLLAVAFSVAALMSRLALPQIARLGRLPGTHDFADITRHPEAEVPSHVGIWRPSEALFFANAERTLATIAAQAEADPAIRVVVLSLEETLNLDSTALEAIQETDRRIAASGRTLLLARARDPVRDILTAAGAIALVQRAYYSVEDTADAARKIITEAQTHAP
ncbi:high affinity sulfate transporter 1 [Rhizobium aquaticum]|uniref:High affinity sulfate transporter 1 n=1 Tax=Rhizobium aquaticum TaxID=1549636 RepID=A0ABV2J6L8_9HYPH